VILLFRHTNQYPSSWRKLQTEVVVAAPTWVDALVAAEMSEA